MPSIKEFNVKLKSLRNTRKITKTMKMVAASKLRKAQEAQANAKNYANNLMAMTSRIASAMGSASHPLLVKREPVKKVLILVVTSDKGLCGAFNNNANRRVLSWVTENRSKLEKVELSFCGKRGYNFFRKNEKVKTYYENVTGTPKFSNAEKIGCDLMDFYLNKEYDEVYIAYNQFFSPISQKTIFEKILPVDPEAILHQKVEHSTSYSFEPEESDLLKFLIPHYMFFRIYFALLENSAGEHGARMSAMDSASKNAADLIDRYTLRRNRARQAQITTELTEIVAGAEALN